MARKFNLLRETLMEMNSSYKKTHYSPADVAWVGSRSGSYATSWEEFAQMADVEIEGFQVPPDLVIVFKDGSWLEWDPEFYHWVRRSAPTLRPDHKPLVKVIRTSHDYHSISDLNEAEDSSDN